VTSHGGDGIDITRPSVARVYDALLGGTDNYPADRAEAAKLTDPRDGHPGLGRVAQENRRFLSTAVTKLAGGQYGAAVSQFIDAGAGLPTRPSVHEAARAVNPAARVAYVDRDPEVVTSIRHRLAVDSGIAAVSGDITDPAAVLADPALRKVISLARPVCVILAAVLHFMDSGRAAQVTAGWMAPLVPGSWAVISVAHFADEALAARIRAKYAAADWHNHGPDDLRAFAAAAGLELLGEPADVRCWPIAPPPAARDGYALGAVGVKR
jgi:hypothetical protein